jgi:hypothetical protein
MFSKTNKEKGGAGTPSGEAVFDICSQHQQQPAIILFAFVF